MTGRNSGFKLLQEAVAWQLGRTREMCLFPRGSRDEAGEGLVLRDGVYAMLRLSVPGLKDSEYSRK